MEQNKTEIYTLDDNAVSQRYPASGEPLPVLEAGRVIEKN